MSWAGRSTNLLKETTLEYIEDVEHLQLAAYVRSYQTLPKAHAPLNQTPSQKIERGLRGTPANEVAVAGKYQFAMLRVRVVGEGYED